MGKTQTIGDLAERIAHDYLKKQGLKYVERNYRCQLGEIDLIMYDRDTLSFIEVRYRRNQTFGGALHSVTTAKQKKLLRAVQYYLQNKRLNDRIPYRFDVLAISGDLHQPEIEWVKNITMTF